MFFKVRVWLLALLVLSLIIAVPPIRNFINENLFTEKQEAKEGIEPQIEDRDLVVTNIYPYMDSSDPYVSVRFNEDVDTETARSYFSIIPDIPYTMNDNYMGVSIHADFDPSKEYVLVFLEGMPSVKGSKIKETIKEIFMPPDYVKSVLFKTPGVYLSLEGSRKVPVETVNVDKLKVKVHKVYSNNIVYLLNNMSSYSIPDDLGVDVYEKEIETKAGINEFKEVVINLKNILKEDSKGLFFIEAGSQEYYYGREKDERLILLTDTGISVQKGASDMLVWVNSLSGAEPIQDSVVSVYTKTNQKILEGKTDTSGIIHFKGIDWEGDRKPFVVTADNSATGDLSFIRLDRCEISKTDFDITGRPYVDKGYEAFMFTERGVYRPGEKARVETIVRKKGMDAAESFPVIIEITRPDGRQFDTYNGILGQFGSVGIELEIPDTALTGKYKAEVKLPGQEKSIGQLEFNVEEFMPVRMKAVIETDKTRIGVSESTPLTIQAMELFGGPAKGKEVELKCDISAIKEPFLGYKGFIFKDETKELISKNIKMGEGKTDDEGKCQFMFKFPKAIQIGTPVNCSLTATVKEVGGRAVTSYKDMIVDPYERYIGISPMSKSDTVVGDTLWFQYVVVDPSGSEKGASGVKATVSKVIWNNILRKDTSGKYRYVSERVEEVVKEEILTGENSSGTYEYTPKTSGEYVLRISDGASGHTSGVRFYVSGSDMSTWKMDKPDRIELKLDKDIYAVGDTAKLTIKSPFKGKALLVLGKDEILTSEVFDLNGIGAERAITITPEMAPNAYVSVMVIKDVSGKEKWNTYRALGIIPLLINNKENELNVELTAAQNVAPGEELKVRVRVTDNNSLPVSAELTIMAVDEGILALTGFNTPDPFGYFYGKRMYGIDMYDMYPLVFPELYEEGIGSDSTPSSDKAKREAFDPRKHLNPVSAKRVRSIVLFKDNIVTDSEGKAEAAFTVPEFCGSLRIMVVAASGDKFGNADKTILSTEPIMVEAELPRFLTTGDKFEFPVRVYNKTGSEQNITCTVESTLDFDNGTRTVAVPDNDSVTLMFRAAAPLDPGKKVITIKAEADEYKTQRSIEIPVRAPTFHQSVRNVGHLKTPGEVSIQFKSDWMAGSGKYSLKVMSSPALNLAGGLDYLIKYPYGCIEQTTSSVFPLLYMRDVVGELYPEQFNGKKVDHYIDKGMKRILSMQTYSGGFSMWPGYDNPYPWGSVYASDFLIEAENAGYSVPKKEKKAALNYLEKLLSSSDKYVSDDLKAYAAYVLAKGGRVQSNWIRRLEEKKDKLNDVSKFYLAASMVYLNDNNAASKIMNSDLPGVISTRETGGSLRSPVQETAILLSIYMDIDPYSENVPKLASRLNGGINNAEWMSTQDNARALIALGKYIRYFKSDESSYAGRILSGDKIIADFTSDEPLDITDLELAEGTVDIEAEGSGTLYYYWTSEGLPRADQIKDVDSNIKVRRAYLDLEGNPADLTQSKPGDLVVVDISIEAELGYKNVLIEDLLPACFEIENPRLSNTEKLKWSESGAFVPDHIDYRDDRMLLFTDLPRIKNMHYRYLARIISDGEFTLPAIRASCMYDSGITSVNGQGILKIKGNTGVDE